MLVKIARKYGGCDVVSRASAVTPPSSTWLEGISFVAEWLEVWVKLLDHDTIAELLLLILLIEIHAGFLRIILLSNIDNHLRSTTFKDFAQN